MDSLKAIWPVKRRFFERNGRLLFLLFKYVGFGKTSLNTPTLPGPAMMMTPTSTISDFAMFADAEAMATKQIAVHHHHPLFPVIF